MRANSRQRSAHAASLVQIFCPLTRQLAEAIEGILNARGVAVVIEARHLCVEMRGVERGESETVTSCMLGAYRTDAALRAEFMEPTRPTA